MNFQVEKLEKVEIKLCYIYIYICIFVSGVCVNLELDMDLFSRNDQQAKFDTQQDFPAKEKE